MSNQSAQNTHSLERQAQETVESVGAWRGGSVIKVALSPDFTEDGIALAATLAGLFRSQDHGQSWQLSMDGMNEPTLTTVLIAGKVSTPDSPASESSAAESSTAEGDHLPIEGPIAYAGTESGRLYRSYDLGQSWQECATWAGLGVLTDLAAAPNFNQQPYLFAATIQGAFRSLDAGETWESCTFGLLDDEVLCMVCAPDFAQSQLVWCGTGGGGFYRSRNAARAWREAGLGLPDSAIQALAVSPNFAADRTLYAGMEDGGLYRSADGGENWMVVGRATEPLPGAVNSLALTADIEPSESPSSIILAGTNWGVFWSEDGGEQWETAAGGDFIALHFAVGEQRQVIAGALSDGLSVSADGGKSWSPVTSTPAAHAPPLIAAPTPKRLFALDHDGVMAQSIDSGANWSPPPGEAAEGLIAHMAIFSLGAGRTNTGEITVFAAGENHLLRGTAEETESEIQWTTLAPPVAEMASAPLVVVSPTYVQEPALLWGHYSGDMHLSTDGGENWTLTARPWSGEMTLSITMGPNFVEDRRMVAIAGRQAESGHFRMSIWQTHDAAQSWTELASLETETPAMLAALPAGDPAASIFLATRNRLIRLFTPVQAANAEADLEVHQTIFDEDQRVTALAVSPHYAEDQTVFAGIDGCIQFSRDGGVTWDLLAQMPNHVAIVAIVPHDPKTGLQIVTLGGQVWRCPWPAR